MWILIWGIAVVTISLYDYYLLKGKHGKTRIILWLIAMAIAIPLPLLVPENLPKNLTTIVCFLFAIFSFSKIIKSCEIAFATMPDPKMVASFPRYLLWCICLPDTFWPADREEARQIRQDGRKRLLRAIPKVLIFLGVLSIFTIKPDLYNNYWLFMFIFLWCCYFAFTGFTDLFTGIFMQTGIRVSEMFNQPYLSRSPRDLWGRRWNLYFRDLAHRNIFLPLKGRERPLFATFMVFFVSGIFHEYLIIMSVGLQKVGWMLAFFMVHWLGTIIETIIRRRSGKKQLMPQPLAILLNTLWMLATIPLLAEPLLLVVPIHTWHLW